jgi:hypothetical protein
MTQNHKIKQLHFIVIVSLSLHYVFMHGMLVKTCYQNNE